MNNATVDYKVECKLTQCLRQCEHVSQYWLVLVMISSVVGVNIPRTQFLLLISLSNTNLTSTVPLMYHSIYYAAFRCPFSESCMYLLIIFMACDKFDLEHTIAYIKLSTALTYDTWDMYSHSSTSVGDSVAASLKRGANDILKDFVSLDIELLWCLLQIPLMRQTNFVALPISVNFQA